MRQFGALLLALCATLAAARPTVRLVRDKKEFDKLISHHGQNTGLPVIVDFFSESCGPCKMIAPAFNALAKEYKGKAVFAKVDVNANQQTSSAQGVRSMPTFQFFLGGKKKNEFSGAGEQQLRQITGEMVRESARQNVLLTKESLVDYYAKHDASKSEADVGELHDKCVVGADKSAKAAKLSKPGACVGAAADELARKLKKKYKEKPTLAKRFTEEGAADAKDDGKKEKKEKESKPSASKSSKAKAPKVAEKANVHLATDDDLISELAKRGIELNPSSAEADEAEEEDYDEYDEDEDEDFEDPNMYHAGHSDYPERVTVIGGGPAGLAAAIYAARAGLRPVVVAPPFGGQLMGKGVDVENYPGLLGMTGPGVVQLMQKQAKSFGTMFEEDSVVEVDLSSHPFVVRTNHSTINTHSLIIATGADSRWLGVPGEHKLRGGGVSTCATCDGFLFRDKPVVVVGGGDTAMEDALVLARTSSSVTLIHRRDSFRASHALAQRVLNHPTITVRWNTSVVEFKGTEVPIEYDDDEEEVDMDQEPIYRLSSVLIRSTSEGADPNEHEEISCDGAFVAIGHEPNTKLFNGQLAMESTGYLETFNSSTACSVEGVYAAGDVADHVYRQAITSAGSGAMASLDAERWLSTMGYGNEEEEAEAALMAELMSSFEDSKGEAAYNVYENDDMSHVGRKESTAKGGDEPEVEVDQDDLLKWASATGVGSEL